MNTNKKLKIAWLTSAAFLDTDIYVVPNLMNKLDIDWYILKKVDEKIDYDEDISRLMNLKDNIFFINMCGKSYGIKRAWQFYELFWKIKKYDIYYLEMFGMPFFIPMANCILNKKRAIVAIHNVHVPLGGHNYHLAKLYRDYTLWAFSNFQTFSKSQENILRKMKPNKIIYRIPFALKDFGYSTKEKTSDLITFMNFGNIRPYKCIDILIDAAQEAYEKTNIKFKVIIAGKCENWNIYMSKIKYTELFDLRLHRIDNDEVPNLFAESDYFVAPYQDIAQSGSAIIAINYEKPIIASRLEAFEEYITDRENGYLITPADKCDLRDVIIEILNNHKESYPLLKNRIVNIKNDQFAINSIEKKYIKMFEEIGCHL